MCEGINCPICSTCWRFKIYLEYSYDYMTNIPTFVEPAYNGSYCENYIKTIE